MWWIEAVIRGIVWGIIAAATSALGMCLTWAWFVWRDRHG